MSVIVTWNGKEVPEEMRDLPEGRYVVERIDYAPQLSDDAEAGLEAALTSLRSGKGIVDAEVRRRIDAVLER